MIFFKPTEDPENINIIDFEAIENDCACGKCTMFLSGSKAEITELICDADKAYLVEGLIKSAFNYAALKNCYMGYCKSEEYSILLDRMNFVKENGLYFNDIPTILAGNCCKYHDTI